MSDEAMKPDSDDKWECEGLARSIKEVEMAKKNKPELYEKAMASLKGEAEAILSIDGLRKVAAKKAKDDKNG